MFRRWQAVGVGVFLSLITAQGATIGYAGDSLDAATIARFESLTAHTFRPVTSFGSGAGGLTGLDALWLDGLSLFAFQDLDVSSPSLVNFVSAGHLLLVQSPGLGGEGLEMYPFAADLTLAIATSEATVRVRQELPWLENLTDAQLSNWNRDASAFGNFSSIGTWQGLADNGTDGRWITVQKQVGPGAAIYTFQDISQMDLQPKEADAVALLNSIMVPEPSTYALVALATAIGAFARRRRS